MSNKRICADSVPSGYDLKDEWVYTRQRRERIIIQVEETGGPKSQKHEHT